MISRKAIVIDFNECIHNYTRVQQFITTELIRF